MEHQVKFLGLIGLLFYVSCTQHYDWYIDVYMVAKVENQSSKDVKIAFCSINPGTTSEINLVQTGDRSFTSSTFIRTIVDRNSDRRQNYVPRNQSYDTYAAVSPDDLNFVVLCAAQATTDSLGHRIVNQYLIIEKSQICPDGFYHSEQIQNACRINF